MALVAEQDWGLRDFGDTRKRYLHLVCELDKEEEKKNVKKEEVLSKVSATSKNLRSHTEHLAEGRQRGDTSAKEH